MEIYTSGVQSSLHFKTISGSNRMFKMVTVKNHKGAENVR